MKAARPYPKIIITPKGEAALTGGHPWVYEGEVTAVDGKRPEFKVAAYDEKGLIGEGTHERFIITDERFLGKAARKLEK